MEINNYPDKIETTYTFYITAGQSPERVDIFLSRAIGGATRNRVQKAIDMGCVKINGKAVKASRKVQPGDNVECVVMKLPPIELVPENIPLEVLFEDDYLMVINKPSGMCVHPGFGNRSGTLVNALLHHFGITENVPIEIDDDEDEETSEGEIFAGDKVRPGLVHRIDKDTSGLLVIAKDPASHAFLAKQFAEKSTEREYWALVWGQFSNSTGEINANLARSNKDRKIFTVVPKGGKSALTDYFALDDYQYISLVKYVLRTGRTHQIRVHSQYLKHPIFGDPFYGGTSINYGGENPRFRIIAEKCLKIASNRQMLHAKTLGFVHPISKQKLRFDSELPSDFKSIIDILKSANY
jgi:23S rRNA pseudouridine1911/1915/1917 synthase